MTDRPKPPVVTSYGALLRSSTEKREVRIPKAGDLSGDVAWIHDPRFGVNAPAVIGITGRYAGIGVDEKGKAVSQWQVWIRPDSDRVNQRFAREDLRDLIFALHTELTATNPRRGATYTAYFAVPRSGGENVFDVTFRGATGNGPDPWLDDEAVYRSVRETLQSRLTSVFVNLWQSWVKDPTVAMLLRGQGVPVETHHRTQFLAGNTVEKIRSELPDAMHRTLFLTGLDDLGEVQRLPRGPVPVGPDPVDFRHLATMLGLVAVAVAIFLLFASAVL